MTIASAPHCVALLALLALPLPVLAQKYPEKGIRLVVAFGTGAPYFLAVLLEEKLREAMGQPVVPDFKAGGGGNLAPELVARAAPDGYTLLLTSLTIAISPSFYAKLGYDTFRDFDPVTLVATVPNVIVVHPSVPARSLNELVNLRKRTPASSTTVLADLAPAVNWELNFSGRSRRLTSSMCHIRAPPSR